MYTQCPSCRTTYRISARQLRIGRGEALCQECQIAFNAITALAENPRDALPGDPRQPVLPVLGATEAVPGTPYERDSARSAVELPSMSAAPAKRYVDWPPDEEAAPAPAWSWASILAWGIGSFMLLGLLAVQVLLFEGDRLVQNPQLRPMLDLACDTLKCALPEFRASQDIRVVSRSLRPTADDDGALEFNLVIANKSSLAQAFPNIRLALTDGGGRPVLARLFTPSDYLPDRDSSLMPVGKPFEIRLLLAKPQRDVVGFEFDLL